MTDPERKDQRAKEFQTDLLVRIKAIRARTDLSDQEREELEAKTVKDAQYQFETTFEQTMEFNEELFPLNR